MPAQSPREGMVRALAAGLVAALDARDPDAARVAHAAIGALLGPPPKRHAARPSPARSDPTSSPSSAAPSTATSSPSSAAPSTATSSRDKARRRKPKRGR